MAWSLMVAERLPEALAVEGEMRRIERATDPPWMRATGLNLHAALLLHAQRFEEALSVNQKQLELLKNADGEAPSRLTCQNNLCTVLNCLRRFESVLELAASIQENETAPHATHGYPRLQLFHAQTLLARLDDAAATLRQSLGTWRRDGMLHFACTHLAAFMAACGRFADAARLDGAALAYVRLSGVMPSPVRRMAREHMSAVFAAAGIEPAALADWRREGESLDEAAIAALCLAAVSLPAD